MCEVRCPLSTGRSFVHEAAPLKPRSDLHTFWCEPISQTDNHFGSFAHDDLYHGFTCVHRTHCLAVTRIVVPRKERLSRSSPRSPKRASVHCPGRSSFRPVGSPGGTGGPPEQLLSGRGTAPWSDFVSQQRLGNQPRVRCRAPRACARVGCIALFGGAAFGFLASIFRASAGVIGRPCFASNASAASK